MVANLAAANSFTAAHLETPLAKEMIKRAQIFYISGFFLTVSVDAILQVTSLPTNPNLSYSVLSIILQVTNTNTIQPTINPILTDSVLSTT